MRRWRLTPSSRAGQLFALTAVAVLLYVGAAAGLAAIPGYDEMRHTLADVRWFWVVASLVGVAAAFAGYLLGLARSGRGAGVFSYRFFSLFAIMPFSFAALPALRSIGAPGASPSPEPATQPASGRPPG